jgi:hypothetical protein
MRLSSAVFLLLGIPLLLAASLPDAKPQAAPGISAPAASGLKVTMRDKFATMTSERTTYIQADRKRLEYRNSEGSQGWNGSMETRYGPHIVAIARCDLGQMFELNLDTSEYVAGVYPPKPFSQKQAEARGLRAPQAAVAGPATLRIETTTVDTGERKQIFGHTARHVITTSQTIPLEGSKATAQESVSDGWYIDLDTHLSCDPKRSEGKRVYTYLSTGNAPAEKMEFVTHGERETGFPVDLKYSSSQTIALPDGKTTKHTSSISETLVTSLEEKPLDPALFSLPRGFRQVEHIQRNPSPSFSTQLSMAWYEFKAEVARLFE